MSETISIVSQHRNDHLISPHLLFNCIAAAATHSRMAQTISAILADALAMHSMSIPQTKFLVVSGHIQGDDKKKRVIRLIQCLPYWCTIKRHKLQS